MTTVVIDDRRAWRNVILLATAQGVMGAQMPIAFIAAGLVGTIMSPNPVWATAPVSLLVLVTAFAAPAISVLMGRYGRKTGFFLGAIAGGLGTSLAAYAIYIGSFTLFCVGHALMGIYMAAQGFYRFAATDVASEAFRPKAISLVLAGGLVSAIVGPSIVKGFDDFIVGYQFAGAYVAAAVLNLFGAAVIAFLDLPHVKPAPKATRVMGRPISRMLRSPAIVTAMICGMVSYALMNLMMTSAPIAVVGCGFTSDTAANVVSLHVLAMFIPSFFTGHLIARFGVERIIAVGLGILLFAGLVALQGVDLFNFYGALILLGIGWNFGFIGATALLASAHSPEERSSIQGLNDFLVFGLVAVASLSSGGLMNGVGAGDVVFGWTAVNIAMVPFLVLAAGTLLWFVLRKPALSPAE
ncbi:MAG: MFS transporter [Pseudomonadota bacterium]